MCLEIQISEFHGLPIKFNITYKEFRLSNENKMGTTYQVV